MSALREAFVDYFAVRRALGFKLTKTEMTLKRFVEFAEGQGASHVTTDLALRWAQMPRHGDPAYCASRLRMVRLFARHCSTLDPRTEVPPEGLLPHRPRRKAPYLYSDTEIVRLVEAARRLPSPTGLRAATQSTLLGLLAVTGMRRSEPIALDREDVDLAHGVITVRSGKFGKSRLLPLHPSTLEVLQRYAALRDRLWPRPSTPSFFLTEIGTRVSQWALYAAFVKVSRETGLRAPTDRHGPRLHDLRHSFAVRTLLGWYREGDDVERLLPRLATYLGHRHLHDTYWYLSATPEGRQELRRSARGLLLRPARPPAAGQSAHHRQLPRHLQAAAAVCRRAAGQGALHPRPRGPRRALPRRLSSPPRDRSRQ